ncbi:hypothetical protein GWK77_01145 [Candidatus Saccharibacteria bacterium oral taxon 488]|nr:hypothetical protein GWK77_01145 [Candidatus Saccharibacteria bacterium oral taxon 488]
MANLDLLPPDIQAAANNAWQRAQEGQKAQSLNTSQGFGSAALLNTLNADVREAREKNKTGFNSLNTIPNPETQRAFEKAFTLSERLVSYIGLSAPTPEQMVSVGVNLQYLAEQFALMEQEEGVTPHVVLAPHGLGKQNWLTIGQKMATDTTIPNNSLRTYDISNHGVDVCGLKLPPKLEDNVWYVSDQVPTSTTTPRLATLPTYQDESYSNINWTLRLLSGRNAPDHMSMSYEQSQKQVPSIEHQTIAEGLTDKFTAILAGKHPTDSSGYSSLCRQVDPDTDITLSVCFDIPWGIVIVSWQIIGDSCNNIGIRSPIG